MLQSHMKVGDKNQVYKKVYKNVLYHETVHIYAFDVVLPCGFAIIIITKNVLDKIMATYLTQNNGEQNDDGRSWNRGDGQIVGVDPTHDDDKI